MKLTFNLMGNVARAAGGKKQFEVEFDQDEAILGEAVLFLAPQLGEAFEKLALNEEKNKLKVSALLDGQSAVFNTPLKDGAKISLMTPMGGG